MQKGQWIHSNGGLLQSNIHAHIHFMKLEYLAIHTCVINVFNTMVVQCKTLGWSPNYFSLKFQLRESYI